MTRRSRVRWKALFLALTILVVSTLPALSLSGFFWLCAAVTFVVALLLIGMALDLVGLYVGFRAFEQRTDEIARRTFGWKRQW